MPMAVIVPGMGLRRQIDMAQCPIEFNSSAMTTVLATNRDAGVEST